MKCTTGKIVAGSVMLLVAAAPGQTKRPIVPSDCVTVRYAIDDQYHHAIQINPQGTYAAYLIKSPDLTTNRNNFELYVKPLGNSPSDQGRLVFTGSKISQLQWLNDGRHIVALADAGGRTVVMQIDTRDRTHKVLLKESQNIEEFSIKGDGSILVFALAQRTGVLEEAAPDAKDGARGYRILFQQNGEVSLPKRKIFVTERRAMGGWTPAEEISIRSPFTGELLDSLYCSQYLNLSLSPNGKLLLLSYVDPGKLPNRWTASPFVQQVLKTGFSGIDVTVLHNLRTGKTTVPIETPWTYGIPMWSSDSAAFVLASQSPIGSQWEAQDTREHTGSIHLFWVDVTTGKAELVAKSLANPFEGPLAWNEKTGIFTETADHEISRFNWRDGTWFPSLTTSIPIQGLLGEVATDGRDIIGEVQAPTDPPKLFQYRLGELKATIFSDLDPQFRHLTLAPMEEIQWKTSTGYPVHGFLFLPPNYKDGQKYPLVIQTKPANGQFVCDSGQDHFPSFAPQPIANAGILYLIRDGSVSIEATIAKAPKGYPGGIGEAAFQMDVWDSAVEKLTSQGIVDPTRVGIIGFSRSGWYTEFILSHSRIPYRAATSTDNVHYSVGEYWLLHTQNVIRGWDAMYGGPPYGKTLGNWLKYSITFTLDKIHTPLLMEEMGYGVRYDDKRLLPLDLAYGLELFTGLSRLGKPVELYYYPTEEHQPDHPLARLATLQRNLDWYRFWLQGYERPDPDDPTQYSRWSHLEELQAIENNASLSPGFR